MLRYLKPPAEEIYRRPDDQADWTVGGLDPVTRTMLYDPQIQAGIAEQADEIYARIQIAAGEEVSATIPERITPGPMTVYQEYDDRNGGSEFKIFRGRVALGVLTDFYKRGSAVKQTGVALNIGEVTTGTQDKREDKHVPERKLIVNRDGRFPEILKDTIRNRRKLKKQGLRLKEPF